MKKTARILTIPVLILVFISPVFLQEQNTEEKPGYSIINVNGAPASGTLGKAAITFVFKSPGGKHRISLAENISVFMALFDTDGNKIGNNLADGNLSKEINCELKKDTVYILAAAALDEKDHGKSITVSVTAEKPGPDTAEKEKQTPQEKKEAEKPKARQDETKEPEKSEQDIPAEKAPKRPPLSLPQDELGKLRLRMNMIGLKSTVVTKAPDGNPLFAFTVKTSDPASELYLKAGTALGTVADEISSPLCYCIGIRNGLPAAGIMIDIELLKKSAESPDKGGLLKKAIRAYSPAELLSLWKGAAE